MNKLLFILIIPFIISNIIKIPISDFKINNINFNSTKNLYFYPMLISQFCLFDSFDYLIPEESINTIPNTKIAIDDNELTCKFIQTSFDMQTIHLHFDDFLFIYSIDTTYDTLNLALAYKINERSSIVHHAFNNGFISQKAFSLYIDINWNGYLYLGGVPNEYKEYSKGFCSVLTNYTTWGCNLTSVLFLDFEYEVNNYVYFDSNKVKFEVSIKFDEYFNEKMSDYIKEYKTQDKIEYFPIKFKIENYIYNLPKQIVIYEKGNFEFKYSKSEEGYFILGHQFLSTFVIHFDYSLNIITLYGKENIFELINFKHIIAKNFIFTNILLGLIPVVYLIIIKANLK